MFKKREATRLGEILVSKGIITSEQLAIATLEQTKRKHLLHQAGDATEQISRATLIGEILIELGFIDQLELKRGLNWQERLRHVSIAMALCAPFMTFLPTSAAAQTTSSSSAASSTASKNFTPITIQTENHTTMYGVVNEITADVGGGQNTGSIDTGDWMSYTSANDNIVIPTTGFYQVTMRVASSSAGGTLLLKEASTDATLDTIPIPVTGGWQKWVDVVRTVNLTQGTHNFKLYAALGGFNLNWFKVEAMPTQFPLTIQAESYSAMSGVQNETTTDVGGGQDTGYTNTLDWMAYNNVDVNVPRTESYKITYRVASASDGAIFTLNEAGSATVYDMIVVPKTGGFQSWTSVERIITLPAGKHNFGINVVNGGFNINWFKIEPVTTSSVASSSASSIAAVSASSVSSAASSPKSVSSSSAPASSAASSTPASSAASSTPVSSAASSAPTSSAASSSAASTGFTPITIQAENYSAMSGVQNETTTDVGGGQDTGYTNALDWMVYYNVDVNIPKTDSYKITYRVASASDGASFTLSEAGTTTIYDTIVVPKTGGFQSWTSVERIIALPAGKRNFGINVVNGGFNINWFKIEAVTSTPSSVASSSASSIAAVWSSSVSSAASSPASVSSSSKSSAATTSSATSSSPSTAVSTKTVAGAAVTHVSGTVGLQWTAPKLRENGNYLDITELGGYEIRYRLATANTYTYLVINDPWTFQYNFPWLDGDYIFQIAAFDKNGIYSDFADIHPR